MSKHEFNRDKFIKRNDEPDIIIFFKHFKSDIKEYILMLSIVFLAACTIQFLFKINFFSILTKLLPDISNILLYIFSTMFAVVSIIAALFSEKLVSLLLHAPPKENTDKDQDITAFETLVLTVLGTVFISFSMLLLNLAINVLRSPELNPLKQYLGFSSLFYIKLFLSSTYVTMIFYLAIGIYNSIFNCYTIFILNSINVEEKQ